ncbi:MAG: hypothetical protein V1706_01655 [Pseudomonadota bacterium]
MTNDNNIPKFFFDKNDYILLNIVNDVLNRDESHKHIKNLLTPYLHPHGIKEMTASMGLRIAYAVIHLLGSLEAGKAADRQNALRSLRDEVLCSSQSTLRRNTARVLIEIMKELIRSQGDYLHQLVLARDFRTATFGKPSFIRSQLNKYHLIEMPEEWNQIAFDDHVHDANTKGRKSPTHLVMDAWIKGIRRLTVIYYNFINVDVATELLESAEIMGITVRIGIEFSARFRGRYIKLIWAPRGFADKQDFLNFFKHEPAKSFMDEGRRISAYQQLYVIDVFREFNKKHLPLINQAYGINLPPFERDDFIAFVGSGQPSLLHLAKFIHNRMLPAMRALVVEFLKVYDRADQEERLRIAHAVEIMNTLDPDAIIESFLQPSKNPTLRNPDEPYQDPDIPSLLQLSPVELLHRLHSLHSGSRVTLNLSNLSPADVLELLYDCRGKITHLEIFNLKDYTSGKSTHNAEINKLQLAINQANVINLKRVIQKILHDEEETTPPPPDREERRKKLTTILHNMPALQGFYKNSVLKSRIGSDSTGSSRHRHGMGLVMKGTLPHRAQRKIEREQQHSRWQIPVRITAHLQVTHVPKTNTYTSWQQDNVPWEHKDILTIPSCKLIPASSGMNFHYEQHRDWVVQSYSTHMGPQGNVATLGWIQEQDNQLTLTRKDKATEHKDIPVRCLNSHLKNGLKILIGFLPAFTTFALTKDWWFLAYFGAFIWFGITGLRNIIQSVLGAGGITRSPLMKWNDYVSWDRLADSLLFTGFSVPLLDLLIKTLILDRLFGITTATSPFVLYTVMALANGIYISSHNIFRGLPKAAVLGNFFRSILSIPLALLFNWGIGGIIGGAGVVAVDAMLQKWAAVISKLASDCVAGFIEGLADRFNNIRFRALDYSAKIGQVFETYATIETLFPDSDVITMLESPKEFMQAINEKKPDLAKILIINALDLLYIWMYQPRAASTLHAIMKSMSPDERHILVASQRILEQEKQISQLFIDGVIGKKFSHALSFYLEQSERYLKSLHELLARCEAD